VVDSRPNRFSSDTLEAFDPESVAVVAFGGSYGGMLATWFRAKYPHVVDGAVAGSAPIWSFTGETPPVDPNAFALGVSFDATAWGGSPAACEGNVRAAFAELLSRTSSSSAGVASIAAPLRLCASSVPTTADDVVRIAYWLQDAFDYLAMGNFPYPDSYILMGDGTLPAFPFRAACAKTASAPNLARREKKKPDVLLEVLADFADVYYNYTRRLPCFDLKGTNGGGPNAASAADSSLWDWQFCTEMFMPTARDGVRDIFFPQPWNATRARARCVETWGVEPRATWADTSFGGRRLRALSNVVWSNGALDPWSRLGVNRDTDFLGVLDSRRGLEAVRLPNGAHHLDFFWSRDDDDDDTRRARSRESALVRGWIEEKHAVGGGKRRNGAVVA
jgi:lysosomal Pro-X carboxypeptidase